VTSGEALATTTAAASTSFGSTTVAATTSHSSTTAASTTTAAAATGKSTSTGANEVPGKKGVSSGGAAAGIIIVAVVVGIAAFVGGVIASFRSSRIRALLPTEWRAGEVQRLL